MQSVLRSSWCVGLRLGRAGSRAAADLQVVLELLLVQLVRGHHLLQVLLEVLDRALQRDLALVELVRVRRAQLVRADLVPPRGEPLSWLDLFQKLKQTASLYASAGRGR